MDYVLNFFFTETRHFLVNASDEQIIFMTAGGEETRLGAAAGEKRVQSDGGTYAQSHGRAEELGSREAEPRAGILDSIQNADGVVLRSCVRFVPGNGAVLADGDAVGKGAPGVDADDELHGSFKATSVSMRRRQAGQ